jgi:hypothetical protein
MATIVRAAPLIPPKAPNLPIGPVSYSQQFTDQYSNVLRLYFNQIDNGLGSLLAPSGGSLLEFPNGAFYQDGYTTLSANITNVSTAPIQVANTSGFLTSGAIIIGDEVIKYTNTTATTFGGTIVRGAYGSTNKAHNAGVYVSEAQPVPSNTTALTISLTATTASNQVSIDTNDITKVNFDVAGYYNIQFSVQLLSFDSQIDDVTLWFRQNGTDIPNSAGVVSVPAIHAGRPGAAIVSWNIVLPVNAGDYIQLLMASQTGNTLAATYPPGTAPVHPASPSIILTATFVSALYP